MAALAFHREFSFGAVAALCALSVLSGGGAARAGLVSDRLLAGQSMTYGQYIASGPDILVMQRDGNLVLYAAQGVAIWASNTQGYLGARVVMQPDGNLILYDTGNVPRWSTRTAGLGGTAAVLQGNGNVVITAAAATVWTSNTYKKSYAANRYPLYGWPTNQWSCLRKLWQYESGWNEFAGNPVTGPYGIPQAYPANKMAVDGADYLTNPFVQIHWGEDYIAARYGTPCAAWAFELAHNWY